MSPANPITEDSFEKARKAFFETPMAIRKANAPPAEHANPRNEHPRSNDRASASKGNNGR
jgi:hypothetical protein